MLPQIGDADVYDKINPEDLWCADKLILAKRLGYYCGPAGIAPKPGKYIVRPVINLKMMGVGASVEYLDRDSIPDGYFWCEVFQGRHLSFDYNYGKQTLAVEGFRNQQRLDRFSHWSRVADIFALPPILQTVAEQYPWFNVEVIGDKVIEVHFRYNDDFANHTAQTIVPVWQDEFYASECGDRLGFILIKDTDVRNNM
jgi:hypothetical protein